MTSKRSSDKEERRIFGRRSGRPLNKGQKEAMETVFPSLCLMPEDLTEKGDIDPASLFDKPYDSYTYEIGFGMGEHLAALMQEEPNTGFFGAEPYVNGMAMFCKHIKDAEHKNVRALMDDAMYLARSLAPESLDTIYILNPDPWHKKRHHKRRIISSENLEHFSRVLKPSGRLIASTDVPYLAEWIVTQLSNHAKFSWAASSCNDWKKRPSWWLDHKYANKGAKGSSQMYYFIFHKT